MKCKTIGLFWAGGFTTFPKNVPPGESTGTRFRHREDGHNKFHRNKGNKALLDCVKPLTMRTTTATKARKLTSTCRPRVSKLFMAKGHTDYCGPVGRRRVETTVPYFSIDNAHLMYNAHPKVFRHSDL